MSGKVARGPASVISGALIICAIAVVALIGNFSEIGVGQTWPVVVVAVGCSLALFGFLELGLGLVGIFLVWLLGNLDVIPEFGKSWPFSLIWVVVVVVIGYLRARRASAR